MSQKSDIEISQAADIHPIADIGDKLGIPSASLIPYGNDKAKIDADFIKSNGRNEDGRLILVTAMSPTPVGEGKRRQPWDSVTHSTKSAKTPSSVCVSPASGRVSA